jgi:hypothetical protein
MSAAGFRGSAEDPLRGGAARPIRGQASKDDADALREEGIDFASLPPFLTRGPPLIGGAALW